MKRRTEFTIFAAPVLMIVAAILLGGTLRIVRAAPAAQTTGDGETLFKQKCTTCHTFGGGRLVGPDLKGVTQRRDVSWLSAWMKAPNSVLASGDATATQMVAQYGMQMPNMGLSDSDVASLIAYFQSMDGAPSTSTGATQPSTTQAPPAQTLSGTDLVVASNGRAEFGEQLFTGAAPLQNGGTHCMACHTVNGVGSLGGGALGPDLTHVYARYGRQGLASALGSLPFPTMQGVFANKPLSDNDQIDLLAFFEQADQDGGQPRTQQNLLSVLGSGAALAIILLAGMLIFWPRQRMGIAERLRRNGRL